MLSIQVSTLLLTFLILKGDAAGKQGNAVTGCRSRCIQRGGECIAPGDKCGPRKVISLKNCDDEDACRCCKTKGRAKAKGRAIDKPNPKNKKVVKNSKDRDNRNIIKKEKGTNKSGKKLERPSKKTPNAKDSDQNPGKKPRPGNKNKKNNRSENIPKKKKTNNQKSSKENGPQTKSGKENPRKKGKKNNPKKSRSGKKKARNPKKTNGKNKKRDRKGKGGGRNKCEIKCKNDDCVNNKNRCDKVNDCGDNDDTDEKGCKFVNEISCLRCKTWDTGDVGAKYDPSCGTTDYDGNDGKADPADPFIGCAIKVYKNGDVVRLFQSWQYNATQGNCYSGADHGSKDPEYQYIRCWCKGDNCNAGLCEECN